MIRLVYLSYVPLGEFMSTEAQMDVERYGFNPEEDRDTSHKTTLCLFNKVIGKRTWASRFLWFERINNNNPYSHL